MPCYHPLPAWRNAGGVVSLREPRERRGDEEFLRLPCGSCLGCRMSRAREWALRCSLESAFHDETCWVTLTYDDQHKPPTLSKDHLSKWVKRLRARLGDRRLRFFASGEYGEQTYRPHYHAILFGMSGGKDIQEAWPFGFTRTDPLTPAAIAYVAGYAAKKIGWKLESGERLDYDTGEVYEYQPPFVLMSRRPGIADQARKYWQSWRKHAVYHGREVPVPRFLHQAYLAKATDEQVEQLKQERKAIIRDLTRERLDAAEAIAQAKQKLQSQRRKL